jgi:hypothetical protein
MRALIPFALFVVSFLPSPVEAQPRIMIGGGVTSPNGSLTQSAATGYHGQVGLHVGIPTLPIAFRADGGFHRLSGVNASFARTQILAGSLSGVLTLPGISLSPYLLAGVGTYRKESGAPGSTQTVSDTGYHGGFGVNIGAGGLGAFAEIRFVQINRETVTTRFIPLTFGIRL